MRKEMHILHQNTHTNTNTRCPCIENTTWAWFVTFWLDSKHNFRTKEAADRHVMLATHINNLGCVSLVKEIRQHSLDYSLVCLDCLPNHPPTI